MAGHEPLVSRLEERRAEVQAGWGDKYVDRVHEKDKLTTRERLERLKDEGSNIFEVGTFVNYGLDFDGLRSPAAGVVTAFVRRSRVGGASSSRTTTRSRRAPGGPRPPKRSNAHRRSPADCGCRRFT